MKIYKRPLFKSDVVKWQMLPILLPHSIYVITLLWGYFMLERNIGVFYIILFTSVFISPVVYISFKLIFYIELYDDKIILVNGILKFWRKEYLFSEYPVCGIEYNRGYITNIIKMRKHSTKGLFPFVGIDLVDPRDLKEIVSFMEQRGVVVKVKDIKELES